MKAGVLLPQTITLVVKDVPDLRLTKHGGVLPIDTIMTMFGPAFEVFWSEHCSGSVKAREEFKKYYKDNLVRTLSGLIFLLDKEITAYKKKIESLKEMFEDLGVTPPKAELHKGSILLKLDRKKNYMRCTTTYEFKTTKHYLVFRPKMHFTCNP